MSDDVRTCTCYKKIKSVAVIMSIENVLFEMEVVKNAKKFWLGVVGSESI